MRVINIVEQLVWDHLDEIMAAKPECCRCEKCRADCAAIALNHLQPKYVVTQKGETFAKAEYLERQLYLQVVVALTEAVEKVSAFPMHDRR